MAEVQKRIKYCPEYEKHRLPASLCFHHNGVIKEHCAGLFSENQVPEWKYSEGGDIIVT